MNQSKLIYKREKIEEALKILDTLNVRGIKECQKVMMLAAILGNPEKGEEDGSR